MNSNLQVLVNTIYQSSWSGIGEHVFHLCNHEEATNHVKALTLCKGWRERRSASLLIVAFDLTEYALPLVQTFLEQPEYHTGLAFTEMLVRLDHPSRSELILDMQNSCDDNSYGNNLKSRIGSIASGN